MQNYYVIVLYLIEWKPNRTNDSVIVYSLNTNCTMNSYVGVVHVYEKTIESIQASDSSTVKARPEV